MASLGGPPATVRRTPWLKAIHMLKEQLLWIGRFETVDELRAAVRAFGHTYNQHWQRVHPPSRA